MDDATESRPKRTARRTAQVASAGALLLATIGVTDHFLAVPVLSSGAPGLQAMSWLTAIALIALAMGQLAVGAGRTRAGAALLSASLVAGCVAIASHIGTGDDAISPAIADWLGQDRATGGSTSLSIAICIISLSLASHPIAADRARFGDGLALVALLLATLALCGYAYGSADLYTVPLSNTMSLDTAVTVLLLACSAILGRHKQGVVRTITASGAGGSITRRQMLFLLYPPVLGWLLIQAADSGQLRLGGAMALLVVLTVAPLLWLILRDGARLVQLDLERARRKTLEGIHLADLQRQLADQVALLEDKAQSRLANAELLAARSKGRYRLLFDAIDVGFSVIEMRFDTAGVATDYRFLEVNTAFANATGLRDVEGRWMRDLAPDNPQYWYDQFGRVAQEGVPRRFESNATPGAAKWYDVHAFPIEDGGRPLVGILFNDITERKQIERTLRDLNLGLEARVQAEVAERQDAQNALLQSQKMEAMGQLVGGVAHDFNNLLSPIMGSLDLLAGRSSLDDLEERMIARALQAAERAKALVQRLLSLARGQPVDSAPIDIDALLKGMAEIVRSTAGPQIQVRIETRGQLRPALADANRVEIAVLNLCVNARDAMPDGGALVIEATSAYTTDRSDMGLEPGRYTCVSVTDTGMGMTAETLKRATEPFYSTKEAGQRSGLGLTMVQGLAAQFGGAVKLRSRLGQGTRVELWLPASDLAVVEDLPAAASASIDGQSGRALVVDDEELVRMTTADMLQELGYETVEVDSAEKADALLQGEAPFDLVVTDHLMPGMTGAEFAGVLRVRQPGLPVLLVSGFLDMDGISKDISLLSKPFRKEQLGRAISQLLGPDDDREAPSAASSRAG